MGQILLKNPKCTIVYYSYYDTMVITTKICVSGELGKGERRNGGKTKMACKENDVNIVRQTFRLNHLLLTTFCLYVMMDANIPKMFCL